MGEKRRSIKEWFKDVKSKFTLDTVPYMMMMVAAILIIGMIDVVNATFNPYRVVTPDYWIEIGLLTIANVLVLTSSTNLTIKHLLATDPDVLLLKRLIRAAVLKLKPDFAEYMHRLNLKRKTKKHEHNIKRKITRLNDKTSFNIRAHFIKAQRATKSLDDIQMPFPPLVDSKRKKFWWKVRHFKEVRYFKRMQIYLIQLRKEWIEENIEYLDVRYSEIKASYIKVGANHDSIYEFEPRSDAKKKFKDLFPRFIQNLALAIFIASFFLEPQTGVTTAMILSISLKMIILGMNWQKGRNYAPVFIVEQTMANDQFRYDKLTEYFEEKGVKLNGTNT